MSELRAGLERQMTEILASQSQPRLFGVSNDPTETTLWSLDRLPVLKIIGGEKYKSREELGARAFVSASHGVVNLKVELSLELESSAGAASWC
jgi:hypothetical protein